MEISILDHLMAIYSEAFPDKYLEEAFSQDKNRNLAELGDSILNLVIYEHVYKMADARPKLLDDTRQDIAKNSDLKYILNRDALLKQYLRDEWGCTSPLENFGKDRASAFLEAIIGAIYLSYGLGEASRFIEKYFPLEK